MPGRTYYVYILASRSRELYVGVTSNLLRRLTEHRTPAANHRGFAARHRAFLLVHVEQFRDPRTAITREKQIKKWTRQRKLTLIEGGNPTFRDISVELGLLG